MHARFGPRRNSAAARPALSTARLPLVFIPNERIAFVGGSLGERMGRFGHFEALLHSRFPKLELVIRNFAWPADEVSIRRRSPDFAKVDNPVAAFGADTFFCFFGYNESFAGPAGVVKFKRDYEQFLDAYVKQYPRDDTGAPPRFVLVSPMAFEAPDGGFLPGGQAENANLKLYAAAVLSIATKRDLPYLDLYDASDKLFSETRGLQFTTDGAHQNEAGDLALAQTLDSEAFGTTNPADVTSPDFARLRAAIADKAWLHAQDYRLLHGRPASPEQEALVPQLQKIRAMAAVRDRCVWDLAQGKPVADRPDDSKTGVLAAPPSRLAGAPKFPSPEESIRAMKVPAGFEVQLVASEREAAILGPVSQINFDARGRLWAACRSSGAWRPGDPRPGDRLLVFDRIDPRTMTARTPAFTGLFTKRSRCSCRSRNPGGALRSCSINSRNSSRAPANARAASCGIGRPPKSSPPFPRGWPDRRRRKAAMTTDCSRRSGPSRVSTRST